MCGIVGYIGDRNTLSVLLNGLTRLEYRVMILQELLSSVMVRYS